MLFCTSRRECGSVTHRSKDKYNFKHSLYEFNETVRYDEINLWPSWVWNTQSKIKQFPTRSDPHILVPSVIPLRTDIRGKSLSLCRCASLTRHRCRSSNVSLSISPAIKFYKFSKMYFSIPVPLTCSISAGTEPNKP